MLIKTEVFFFFKKSCEKRFENSKKKISVEYRKDQENSNGTLDETEGRFWC